MIVPVKKVQLFVLESQSEELLKLLQKNELVMVSETENSFKQDVSYEENMLVRVNRAIKYLEAAQKKRSFFGFTETTYDSFENRTNKYLNFLIEVEETEKNIEILQEQVKELSSKIKELTPFRENDLNMLKMASTKYVDFYHGFIYEKTKPELETLFNEHNIPYSFFEEDERGVAVSFALLKEEQTLYQEVRRLDFKEVVLPNEDMGASKYILNLYNQRTELLKTLESKIETLDIYVEKLDDLYIFADQLASDRQRKLTPLSKAQTRLDILMITGWIKETDQDKLHELLSESELGYEIEVTEPTDDEVVPTALKNNKFVENFEMITEQYSVPSQKDLDPNPAMSFWYWMIFGMMMGDVGYGLLMVVAFGLFLKLKRPKGNSKKLISVLYYSGYTSIFFGIIYGSLFGFDFVTPLGNLFNQNWSPIITPMDSALEMLIISVGIGLVHIIHGLILKTILMFKLKDPLGALAEGISYILILLGIAVMALSLVTLPFTVPAYVAYIMIGIGLAFLLLFSGRHQKKILSKATSGLSGVYGIINILSDILSYSRILALALSTSVIAFTFNTLAGMLHGSILGIIISILIYLIGHVFNFAMGLLSAYIHDSRLQYIEFFGKFYEGGGVAFVPLGLELNYIDEIKNINNTGGN